MTPGAAALIREKALCIYLKTSPETLSERLRPEAGSRPLLKGAPLEERISSLLSEREAIYEKCADAVVATDSLTPEEIAEEIVLLCL